MVASVDVLKALIGVKGRKEQQLLIHMVDTKATAPERALTMEYMADVINYEMADLKKMLVKLFKNDVLVVTKRGLKDVWYLNKMKPESRLDVKQFD